MAYCPEESAQLVILENLFDEMGKGDPNASHPTIFRKFTRAIGIDDRVLDSHQPQPETQALIATYLNLPQQYNYLAALGAVCFASEGIVSTLYTQLQQGIKGVAPFSRDALEFFDLHKWWI